MKKNLFRFKGKEVFTRSCLLAVWRDNSGGIDTTVTRYIIEKMKGHEFCSINPSAFFTLEGVQIENDVSRMPSTRFFRCSEELIILESDNPQAEWYQFLSILLDAAVTQFKVEEIYTIGNILSSHAHTSPREIYSICNNTAIRESLKPYRIKRDLEYQSPPGTRPSLSSYLIWLAGQRNVSAVNLWVTIPFYLAGIGDPRAQKSLLDFFNRRLNLGLSLEELKKEINNQSVRLAALQERSPHTNESIRKLETNITLNEEESMILLNEVEAFFSAE